MEEPSWQQKKELGWLVLARKVLEITGIAESVISERRLADALQQANQSLMYTEVPNGRADTNRAFRRNQGLHDGHNRRPS
jgi:hypothetical protein